MSDTTTHLDLPYLMAAQAQKHVIHNEALRILDGLVQLSVLEGRADPPAAPDPGARYLVTATASGGWAGWEGSIALFDDTAWRRLIPREGWFLWHQAAEALQRFDGATWVTLEMGADVDFASGEIEALGIATGADATNRLAVSAPAVLLTHAGAGHQLKINKAAAGDTASLLFQTGFSGRAEMGLAGTDDFAFKVSPDGAAWHESIRINQSTGKAIISGVREQLQSPRTYYVRKDGDDANSGLWDDASGAFLSIGRAIAVVFGDLDLGPHDVDIQVRAGVYEEFIYLTSPSVGAGVVTLRGEASEPGDVLLALTAAVTGLPVDLGGVLHVWNGCYIRLADLRIERQSGPGVPGMPAIDIRFGGHVQIEEGAEVQLGAASTAGIRMIAGYFTGQNATLRHVADAPRLIQNRAGVGNIFGATIIADDRSYGVAFLECDRAGVLACSTATSFSGVDTTGARVRLRMNGVMDFANKALSSLPGTSDGIIDTGGVYLPGFGDVVERGGNSNGEFIRFANGAQICSAHNRAGDASGSTWTYPAAFSPSHNVAVLATPRVSALARFMTVVEDSGGEFCVVYGWQSSGGSSDITYNAIAIGRWK